MKADFADVERIAKLSRLNFTDEEKTKFLEGFLGVLEHVSAIDGVDTEGVSPCFGASGLVNVLREDVVEASTPAEVLIAAAPESEDGAYLVPRAVE